MFYRDEVMTSIFRHIESLGFSDIGRLINESHMIFAEEWRGGLIEDITGNQALIIGDIHGDYRTLKNILTRNRYIDFLEENNKIIFLGDIIDRGPQQIESINLILYLKTLYKDNIILIRGNHEPPPYLPTFPHDFPYRLISKFGQKGGELYQQYFRLFQVLPHAATTSNKLFLVHGGIPPSNIDINDLKNPDRNLMEYLLWSDPFEGTGSLPSMRGAGHRYGRDITIKFLEKNGLSMIIRGHEPCEGYKFNHGNRVLTLFSRVGEPYFNSTAGYLLIPLDEDLEIDLVLDNIGLLSIEE